MTNIYKNFKLIVYDFDGVMTDNKVLIDSLGNEYVSVNRSDGLAVSLIKKKYKVKQIILSTEKNNIVKKRAKKLNIECFNNIDDKKNFLIKFLIKNKIKSKNVVYIGNEINDLEVMKFVGYKFCPIDANNKIKKISTNILRVKGGDGVILYFYEKYFK